MKQDYRTEIIKLVQSIQEERLLRYIYILLIETEQQNKHKKE